jgi:hypothetical protein
MVTTTMAENTSSPQKTTPLLVNGEKYDFQTTTTRRILYQWPSW